MDSQNKNLRVRLPELLSPAGSEEALCAAVSAGADAVYFGGASFSNRMRAKNFTREEIRRSIEFCHSHGVKCYITVNTRVRDIELDGVIDFCRFLNECRADALIVADMGIAKAVSERFPNLELHASTQMSLATAYDGAALQKLGFTRMVVPRELDYAALRRVCAESPLETELFIHGAHCVSYSGQCLMSWAMGGRSGNRGECAQPCRMMYKVVRDSESLSDSRSLNNLGKSGKSGSRRDGGGQAVKSAYPLSLKDMCLAGHIPEIISAGAASLKIEGRQKSAAYVYGVTSVYRKLLDERRAAERDEIKYLESLFSRDGFTDGYFSGNYSKMLGIRRDSEEPEAFQPASAATAEMHKFTGMSLNDKSNGDNEKSVEKYELSAEFTLKSGCPAEFILKIAGNEEISACVTSAEAGGDMPVPSTGGAAVTPVSAAKNLTKFGGTNFSLSAENIAFDIEPGLYYPISGLNALRRACADKLLKELEQRKISSGVTLEAESAVDLADSDVDLAETETAAETEKTKIVWAKPDEGRFSKFRRYGKCEKSCEMLKASQVSAEAVRWFDRIYVPHYLYGKVKNGPVYGKTGAGFTAGAAEFDTAELCAVLPAVVYDDSKTERILDALSDLGCRRVMVNTIGQLETAKSRGFTSDGSFRLNLTNSSALEAYYGMGLETAVISPELKLPAVRDLKYPCGVIVYGRLPLMITERCFISNGGCADRGRHIICSARLTDRQGEVFPVYSDGECRSVIYNSRRLWMADRLPQIRNMSVMHFIFTDETPDEVDGVIEGYRKGRSIGGRVKRI